MSLGGCQPPTLQRYTINPKGKIIHDKKFTTDSQPNHDETFFNENV